MPFSLLRRDRVAAAAPPRALIQGPRGLLGDRFELEPALLTTFAACCAIELVLLPVDGSVTWAEVGPALGLQVLIALAVLFRSRSDGRRSPFLGVLGVIAYLVSVALLREGSTPTAGYGILVLLPVVWASLRGSRAEFGVAIAGVAAVYLLPLIVIGPPRYPVSGWRMGLLLFVLFTALGVSVRQLVGRVEALMERLEALARTDDLTGLANRRAWRERLEQELTTARRTGRPLAVALFDLDLFKEYNDTRGHLAGDRLLLQASAAWQSALRATDVLARWGGDEFGLLLPDCDLEQGQALVARMRAALPDVTFSAGVVEWDRRSDSEELVAIADRELYSAKQAKSLRSLRSGAV